MVMQWSTTKSAINEERVYLWLDQSCAANMMDCNPGYVDNLDSVKLFPSMSFY